MTLLNSRRLAACLALALALVSHPTTGVETPAESLEFLYIDANTGGSSGGHTAVKLGDTVYHFQNDEGYTRISREHWKRFRFIYNDVDNRNIHSAHIALRAEDLQRIRDRLSLLFITQNRQVDYLTALERDEAVLDALQSGEPIEVSGIGFFEQRSHESAAYSDLRGGFESTHYPGFINAERRRLRRQLEMLRYRPHAATADLHSDQYPDYLPTFSEEIEDLHAHWFALTAIDKGWPLKNGSLIEAGQLSRRHEKQWLAAYHDQLKAAIIQTLASPYPGSGRSLLLSLARYQAISLSLSSGKRLVLDILSSSFPPSREGLTEEEKPLLRQLITQLQTTLHGLVTRESQHPEPDEANYHQIEVAASELKEAKAGLAQERRLSFAQTEGPPRGAGHAVILNHAMSARQFQTANTAARLRTEQFLQKMQATYRYQLITHNCVTELVSAVNSSFEHADESNALGGHLGPGANQGYIPFRFFELVRRHYRVTGVETLPSYRNQRLTQLTRQDTDWVAIARESNTLTSDIYRPLSGDSAFLMFTENAFWTRPLLGTLNFGYGLAATAAGLFTAPVDEGLLLKEGLFGLLFSVPELGFWNIRKGSFNEMSLGGHSEPN